MSTRSRVNSTYLSLFLPHVNVPPLSLGEVIPNLLLTASQEHSLDLTDYKDKKLRPDLTNTLLKLQLCIERKDICHCCEGETLTNVDGDLATFSV